MLAIFNTIGQLVDGLCRDHTIAKGLSLKFATSGGLKVAAQWAGCQSEGLATAFAPLYSWVYRRKGSVHRIDVGAACGGLVVILYPVRCIARSGRPKKRPMLRIIGLRMFARAVCPPYVRSWFCLGTSKAQTHLIRHSNYLQT